MPHQREVASDYLQSIVDTVREPIAVLDSNLYVASASRAFYRVFAVTPEQTQGRRIYDLGNGQWDVPALRRLLEEILPNDSAFEDFEVECIFPDIGRKTMLLNARKLYRPGDQAEMILLAMEDVTERRRVEEGRRIAEAALRAAYEREHKIAGALQRTLTQEIAEDAFPGLAVATLYEPALDEALVGGDFFDAFTLPGGQVAVAIADASGKGLPAAARTIQLKDVLRAFTRERADSPAVIVARLNAFVCDTGQYDEYAADAFLCFTLVILDPRTGEGAVTSAGCEPPLILRANGDAEELNAPGMPLGVTRTEEYHDLPLRLLPGDTILLVTDGITEARRAGTRGASAPGLLGYEGMIDLAKQASHSPSLREMGWAILDGARRFGGGALQDDACVVLARRR